MLGAMAAAAAPAAVVARAADKRFGSRSAIRPLRHGANSWGTRQRASKRCNLGGAAGAGDVVVGAAAEEVRERPAVHDTHASTHARIPNHRIIIILIESTTMEETSFHLIPTLPLPRPTEHANSQAFSTPHMTHTHAHALTLGSPTHTLTPSNPPPVSKISSSPSLPPRPPPQQAAGYKKHALVMASERGDRAGVLRRAGQAAVVTAAAMFGGVGMAQAAMVKEQQAAAAAGASSSVTAAAVAPPGGEGARDLGMLLAVAPDEDAKAEARERAAKLAQVRRIKAERQAALNTKKDKKKDEAAAAAAAKSGKKPGKPGKAGKAAQVGLYTVHAVDP
jgi:hypothetical protein